MNISKNILVIANGKFPEKDLIDSITLDNYSVVCCDGAAQKAYDNNIEPDIVIGDMDSISPELYSKLSDRIIHLEDQDTNDLFKALDWLNKKEIESVIIVGANGLREDHSLGNIFVILENKYKYKISMITESGRFDLINTSHQSFESFEGQPVSIFCTDKNVRLNSKGLKYPLNDFSFSKLYDASLNVSNGDSFEIRTNKSNINVLVYRANGKIK